MTETDNPTSEDRERQDSVDKKIEQNQERRVDTLVQSSRDHYLTHLKRHQAYRDSENS